MNIGVFFGSRNTEHDISIITGEMIISSLKGLNHTVIPVYLTKEGRWMIGEDLGRLSAFTDSQKKIDQEAKFRQYYLDLENSVGKLVFKKKGLAGRTVAIDLAFPAFHGAYGEDGTIQGLFEVIGLPYVGCGVAASAMAMDKALTKQICQVHNIPTTKFRDFHKTDWDKNKAKIIQELKDEFTWPLFVKPVHGGSSIGIAKIKDQNLKELESKIEVALYYDNKVIVEEGVNDLMDVTCCLIGNETPEASLLQESVFQSDLFDFEEKYLKDGGSQLGKSQSGIVIPARLDEKTTKQIQETAKEVYKALGCTGIARVDFLYNKKTKEFFANEVNPLPGTLYHHLWKESGIDLPELLEKLLDYAKETYTQKQSLSHAFQSSILSGLNGSKLKSSKLKKE